MSNISEVEQRISEIENEIAGIDRQRNHLLDELAQLRQQLLQKDITTQLSLQFQNAVVNNQSSQAKKIELFRVLFRGREDVFPLRFENKRTGKSGYVPVCGNEWKPGICRKPKIACRNCDFHDYIPVSNEVIRNHLMGRNPDGAAGKDFTMGVYPLLQNETCWFLVVDFDKLSWVKDVQSFLETCKSYHIPAALERSRSGNGGHIWIFFETPVHARQARKLGSMILTKTMDRRPEIGMDSYDRLFPNQDTMPRGGYGNLIALPLQRKPRSQGNSLFVDMNLEPFPDQWAFLSSIQRVSPVLLEQLVGADSNENEITGIKTVVLDETENEPWKLTPSRTFQEPENIGELPEQISIVISNQIFIEKADLSASLRHRIIRLAAFHNPEFYKAQAMRFSTFGKPRIISCCEDYPKHLALPRGCYEELTQILDALDIKMNCQDERQNGQPIAAAFHGKLRPEQNKAASHLLKHDIGVLSASTAFGKTVIGAWLIAQRNVNTLIIVHRRQLMDQWIERLQSFLGLEKSKIGQIGGGKQKVTGVIDVAMIQSLVKKDVVKDLVADYGQVIVDECHHISAVSFEQVIRQVKARHITGLSATVTRQDGHHPIIFMQCGPIRYRVDDRKQAVSRSFFHKVFVRNTNFVLPEYFDNDLKTNVQGIYALLANDTTRNQKIIEDVLAAIKAGRSPVLLTERREHLAYFAGVLSDKVKNVIVLAGGMGRKQRIAQMEQLENVPKDEERLIIATGRYLGEGFDDARLDTLFLSMPISWRGTIAQYAGRLHRDNDEKKEVIIYDYVDDKVPVLAGMFRKRVKGYKSIGYELEI